MTRTSETLPRTSALRLSADYAALRELPVWLLDVVSGVTGTPEAVMPKLELAVHEICVNIVDHAYGPEGGQIDLTARAWSHELRIEVRDSGLQFVADDVVSPEPGRPQVRGYGLMIVNKLVDKVSYERADNTNVWALYLTLPAPAR